jgi:aspartate carbamoyltransferase catalytic subunit
MPLSVKNIISARDLNKEDIESVINMADEFLPYAAKEKSGDKMKGKVMASLFFEPSTRTRLSFETAMKRLGGDVITVTGEGTSSVSKGESFSDTAKVVSKFADIIVIRSQKEGAAEEFADSGDVPVINAGDGSANHPSQALLDIFTIKKELGSIDGLTVAMCGDLKYGRTPNSLAYLLSNYDVKLRFISPDELSMKSGVKEYLKEKNIEFEETQNLKEGMRGADVLYMTRIQRERFTDKNSYEKYKDVYILNRETVEKNNPGILIMHPLPRVNEINTDVDGLPRAAYFRQVENGIAVRMALLTMLT